MTRSRRAARARDGATPGEASGGGAQAAVVLLSATEERLQRLVLDVHDGPVQLAYAAMSQLDLLDRALVLAASSDAAAGPEALAAARDRAARVRALLEDALRDTRGFLTGLRLPDVEARDLGRLLEGLAEQHEAATGTRVTVHADVPLPQATGALKVALYRVVQEALSNASRHGRARSVLVSLALVTVTAGALVLPATRLQLEVRDDGSGFDAGAAVRDDALGLRGIRFRIATLGGDVRIASEPGHGTSVLVEVPVVG